MKEFDCANLNERPGWALIIMRLILSSVVVLVTSFIFFALWSRRRLHAARSHLFVLNLAACGLVGGLGDMLFVITESVCGTAQLFSQQKFLCHLQLLVFIFVFMLNVMALGLIALDRFILIVHSLRYMTLMTKRRALALIGTAWTISGLGALSVLFDSKWEPGVQCEEQKLIPAWHILAVQVPMNGLVLMIVTSIHLRIRNEAWRSEKLHLSLNVNRIQCKHGREWATFTAKSLRVITMVVVCCFLAFTPVQVVLVLELFELGIENRREQAYVISVQIMSLSFLVNPLLYSWKNAHLRADLSTTWKSLASIVRQAVRCCPRPYAHTVYT